MQLPAGGLPLGLRERGADVTRHVDLAAGEVLLLYTDGLTEATHDLIAGEKAVVLALRDADVETAPAQAIHEAVLRGHGASDDVALLVVAFRRSLLDIGGDRGALRWTFDAGDGQAAAAARSDMAAALERRGVAEVDRTFAELVYAELVGNTKRYAPGAIDVALDLSGEYAVLHVIDRGHGIPAQRAPARRRARRERARLVHRLDDRRGVRGDARPRRRRTRARRAQRAPRLGVHLTRAAL